MPQLLVDLSPFRRSPAFARLWAGRMVAGIGGQLTVVAVGLHVYELTGDTFQVAMLGVASLAPTILAGLSGGMLADAFDRRRVAVVAALVSWLTTGAIALLAWVGAETVLTLIVLTAVTAASSTVLVTTESAMVPRLVGTDLLPAANALQGIATGFTVTVGPALAGVLVATAGYGVTYTVDAVLFIAALLALVSLPRMPIEGTIDRPGLASLKSGIDFLRTAPNVRMSFLVDIVAMTFGYLRVLLPAAGALVLGGGALTVGLLTAAFAVGALVSSVLSGPLGAVRRQGVAVLRAITVYGACILGTGVVLLVTEIGIASGALATVSGDPADIDLPATALVALLFAGAGAADNVSAIFRTSILQASAPDSVRGRLQGVFIVVVTGGPRVGDLYVGLLALAGALWLPPVVGGAVIAGTMLVLLRTARRFRAYDALQPVP